MTLQKKRSVEMELIHPNNYCHMCRIPQTYYASYQDLEVLSLKAANDPDPTAFDPESDETDPPVTVGHKH